MNSGRGAHRAMSSSESTGRSFASLRPNADSSAPYFRKFPAIQWYSPELVRFSTASPKSRRCGLTPPSPEEPIRPTANRGSKAMVTSAALPKRDTPSIPTRCASTAGSVPR